MRASARVSHNVDILEDGADSLHALCLHPVSREGDQVSAEEAHVVAALIKLCQQHNVRTLLQIGAEDGYEANEIRLATGCRAICVEPDPKCGPASEGLEWHEVLIGEDNSVVDFFLHSVHGLSSKVGRNDGNEIRVTLPQITLEKFCRRHRIYPDALIIDAEGATMDVLAGAGPVTNTVKLVYAEVSHDTSRGTRAMDTEVDAYLTGRGFKRSMELPTYSCGGQSNWTWTR